MGGGAFAQAFAPGEPTLHTPRMSPDEYERVKKVYSEKMQTCLPDIKVTVLTEAPEKTDYGDIDIFIATEQHVDWADLATQLGAAGVICHSSKKATMAVPKDASEKLGSAVVYKHHHGISKRDCTSGTSSEEYAQVDIEIVSPDLLDWHTFYSSYGDMAGLIGHIVTQLGFTGKSA